MPVLWRTVLSLCLLLSGVSQAEPVAWGEQTTWLSSSSEHFDIHYPSSLKAMAMRSLAIAEGVHKQLVPIMGWQPKAKTQLVLVDDYDLANGWATPFPYNQIRLYTSAPDGVNGLEQMDEWLHGLIRHEYVHILQLDMAYGAPQAGRNWFGRYPFFFPHQFTPSLLIEGLAVFLESNFHLEYGRLTGSYYPMQMRAEVADHGGDQLGQALIGMRDWPLGKNYVYGAYFWQYLVQTYGWPKVQFYLAFYSSKLLPYIWQNSVAKQVFGKNFNDLWNGYLVWLKQEFAEQDNTALSAEFVFTAKPFVQQITNTSGSQLWQVEQNGEDRVQLVAWQQRPNGWARAVQLPSKNVNDIAIADNGAIALSRTLSYASGEVWADLFIWKAQTGWQRLTHQQRFRRVRWLDNQNLIASRQVAGLSELWQVSLAGEQTLLWRGQQGDVLADFSLHNGVLVASLKRPWQGWNLERFDLHTHSWQALTHTRAIEQQPQFLDDGSLLFSANYQGVYNIYRLDKSGKTTQLTDSQLGAFKPHLIGEQLVFQEYSAQGFVLKTVTRNEVEVNIPQSGYQYPRFAPDPILTSAAPYQPWSTLKPHYWLPTVSLNENSTQLGLVSSGADALARHRYEVEANFDLSNQLFNFNLGYGYDTRWQFNWLRDHAFYSVTGITEKAILQRDLAILQRTNLWAAWEDELRLHAAVGYEQQAWAKLPAHVVASSFTDAFIGAGLTLDKREYFTQVQGVGAGQYVNLAIENSDFIEGDYSGSRMAAYAGQWWDLPGRSVLHAGLSLAAAQTQAKGFVIGGSQPQDEHFLFGRSEFSLPGYPQGIQAGAYSYLADFSLQTHCARIERNLGIWPVGLGDISCRVRSRSASAWSHEPESLNALMAELTVELVLGYQLVLPVQLGAARGLNQGGETQFYLQFQLAY